MKTREEMRKKWAEALRSGRYKKNVGFLHSATSTEHRFCVLGVAIDVALEEEAGKNLQWEVFKSVGICKYFALSSKDKQASPAQDNFNAGDLLRNAYGINFYDKILITPELNQILKEKTSSCCNEDTVSIIRLNDSGNFSFEELADIIESATFISD